MYSSLQVSAEVMEFHTTEAYSNFCVTHVQYSIRRLCQEEKKVTIQINPNNLNA